MSGGAKAFFAYPAGPLAYRCLGPPWSFLGLCQTLVPGDTLGAHFLKVSGIEVRTERWPPAETPGDPLGAVLRSFLDRSWEHLLLGETLADHFLRV